MDASSPRFRRYSLCVCLFLIASLCTNDAHSKYKYSDGKSLSDTNVAFLEVSTSGKGINASGNFRDSTVVANPFSDWNDLLVDNAEEFLCVALRRSALFVRPPCRLCMVRFRWLASMTSVETRNVIVRTVSFSLLMRFIMDHDCKMMSGSSRKPRAEASCIICKAPASDPSARYTCVNRT